MRYAAFVMWLVCRNTHKRFFVSIFAFLLLTIKTIKCNHNRIKIVYSFCNLHFATLKVGNFVTLVIVPKAIYAKYPSKQFHILTGLMTPIFFF